MTYQINRETKETKIAIELSEAQETSHIDTGVGF